MRVGRRDDRQQRHLKTQSGEPGQRFQHGGVLGCDADDMPAGMLLGSLLHSPAQGQVVAFGGAAGEYDFARPRRSPRRAPLHRFNGRAGLGAEHMRVAARIAVVIGEVRQHRLHDARIDAGGGMIVEIDRRGHRDTPQHLGGARCARPTLLHLTDHRPLTTDHCRRQTTPACRSSTRFQNLPYRPGSRVRGGSRTR